MDCVFPSCSVGMMLGKLGAIATDWRLNGGGRTPSVGVPVREGKAEEGVVKTTYSCWVNLCFRILVTHWLIYGHHSKQLFMTDRWN